LVGGQEGEKFRVKTGWQHKTTGNQNKHPSWLAATRGPSIKKSKLGKKKKEGKKDNEGGLVVNEKKKVGAKSGARLWASAAKKEKRTERRAEKKGAFWVLVQKLETKKRWLTASPAAATPQKPQIGKEGKGLKRE